MTAIESVTSPTFVNGSGAVFLVSALFCDEIFKLAHVGPPEHSIKCYYQVNCWSSEGAKASGELAAPFVRTTGEALFSFPLDEICSLGTLLKMCQTHFISANYKSA